MGSQRGGLAHNLLMQFSSLGCSKMEFSETVFFDVLTIQNDEICYVMHVLTPFHEFFTLFGCWGAGEGGSRLRHNVLMQFSVLGSSKVENFEIDFFDIVAIQNDETLYLKDVLPPLYVFFTLFGCLAGAPKGGGVPRGQAHNLLLQFSSLSSSKIEFPKLFFCAICYCHHPK